MDKKVITNLTILFVSEYTSCYNWSQADEAFSIISLYKQNWDFYIEYSLLYSITGDETFYQSLILQQQMLSGEQDWDDTPKGSQITNYPTGKHSITDLLSKINMNGKEKDLFNKISTSISEMAIVFSQNLNNNHNNTVMTQKDIKSINKTQNAGLKFKEVISEDKNITKSDKIKITMTKEYIDKAYEIEMDLLKLRELLTNRYVKNATIFMYITVLLYIVLIILEYIDVIPHKNTIMSNLKYISLFMLCYSGFRLINSYQTTLQQKIRIGMVQDMSTILTITARSYCHTGDEKYFNKYWDIVNIRNGDKKWKFFTKIYGIPDGYEDILNFYINLPSTTKSLLETGQEESDALIWAELESFNWKNKRWDKNNEIKNIFMTRSEKGFFYFLGSYDDQTEVKNNTTDNTTDNTQNKPLDPIQASVNNLYSNDYIINSTRIIYDTKEAIRDYDKYRKLQIRTNILFFAMSILLYIITLMFK